jgi:DNA helicase-2/ATP-dependent DNA helicase PcrA
MYSSEKHHNSLRVAVMMDITSNLNAPQARAVTSIDAPLLVVAGPGTGKTLTVVRRLAYLIQQGACPESILAVTFTNRAAREMKKRAEELIGGDAANIFIGTFHLLGLRVIRDSRRDEFIVYSRDAQIELLKSLLEITTKKARQTAEKISRVKNFLEEADAETCENYAVYQLALTQRRAYDFDDLIRVPVDMLENSEELKKTYQDKFKYIVVDEYQDINPAQYMFLKLLAGNTPNICAVGDADQAIYAFRGADLRNFLNFEKDFPGSKMISLSENYRSTGIILNAAEEVIKNNRDRIDKKILPTRGKGAHVTVISVPDERAEGSAIIREIEERIGGTSRYQMERSNAGRVDTERSFRFSDFAVLFRTNAQARVLEEEFSASGIPYQLIGGKNSAQMKEAEETIAYLRLLTQPETAPRTITENAQEAKLLGPADFFDPRSDAVTLTTLHMAKGLEFPVVFITGCEDGVIPCTLIKDCIDIEEERRLYYVGMTRAKDELFILYSRKRFLYGQKLQLAPSPFLAEIPKALVQCTVVPDKVKERKEQDRQLGLF